MVVGIFPYDETPTHLNKFCIKDNKYTPSQIETN